MENLILIFRGVLLFDSVSEFLLCLILSMPPLFFDVGTMPYKLIIEKKRTTHNWHDIGTQDPWNKDTGKKTP